MRRLLIDWRAWATALRWLWVPVLLWFITRCGIWMAASIAAPLLPDSTPPPYHLRSPDNVLLDVFGSRWDTGFYVTIAETGYTYREARLPSVAFFPLLPLMIRTITPLVGDTLVAGLLITNLALVGAVLLLYQLVVNEWGVSVAERAVWYLLIFPTSFFGSAIYSESLFLFSAIGALYLARRRAWESAALLGIMATLTRFMGIIVAPMLLLEWWRQQRAGERPPRLALFAPVVTLLGIAMYMFYLQRMFGDPLAFLHASAAWEREPRSPLDLLTGVFQTPAEGWCTALLAGRIPLNDWIDLLLVLLFLGFGAVLLAQRRWDAGVFVILGALIPLSSGLLMSQRRYVWVLFPAFVLLARWGTAHPWLDRAITVVWLMLLSLFVALFANGYWVA